VSCGENDGKVEGWAVCDFSAETRNVESREEDPINTGEMEMEERAPITRSICRHSYVYTLSGRGHARSDSGGR
jgi:hypothetical protein